MAGRADPGGTGHPCARIRLSPLGLRSRIRFDDPGILGVRKEKVTSRNYRGGRIIAFMGGCELHLTHADMESGPAELEIVAIWAESKSKCPKGRK